MPQSHHEDRPYFPARILARHVPGSVILGFHIHHTPGDIEKALNPVPLTFRKA